MAYNNQITRSKAQALIPEDVANDVITKATQESAALAMFRHVPVAQTQLRIPILSALHASIQDRFNEHGVQIMSPHFLGQPDSAVVVAPQDWYRAPAQPPAAG